MALVKLYRDGALRQRISKGYIAAGRQTERVLSELCARPLALGEVLGVPVTLRADPEAGNLWLDTGMLWLCDAEARAQAARTLAQAVATIARELGRSGCTLLPSGYRSGSDGTPARGLGLCADLHAVEVMGEVQRELCTNLLREHSPLLIALSGRSAWHHGGGGGQGSRRLLEVTDQLTARYIHSCSPAHLARITEGLGRDEGVRQLDSMDVNPLGNADIPIENVSMKIFDAQQSVATTMAHALLVQAIAMRARRLHRQGSRVGAVPQSLIDRNRSRTIAQGLSAVLDTEDRGKTVMASTAALRLFHDLVPEFQALAATADELAPLYLGLRMYGTAAPAVRNENDLVGHWRRTSSGPEGDQMTASCLRDPGWLATDHITAANRESAPGATAVVMLNLAGRLDPRKKAADPPPAKRPQQSRKPGGGKTAEQRGGSHANRATAAADMLIKTLESQPAEASPEAALREYLAQGGGSDIDRHVSRLDRERVRGLRALLRPRREAIHMSRTVPDGWQSGPAAKACAAAHRTGIAMLVVDVAKAEQDKVRDWLRGPALHCGNGLTSMVTARISYRTETDSRMKVEIVVLRSPRPIQAAETEAPR